MISNTTKSDISFMTDLVGSIVTDRNYPLPSEYNEQIRYMPKELSPKTGYYDYNYTPYLREIVDNFSPLSPIREIAFLKPAQIGATTGILEAAIAYFIGACPRPQLYVSADKELVEKGMEVKVDRMLDFSGLRELIKVQTGVKTNKTGDRKAEKDYPGGFLHAIGARSPGKMRQMNYPVLLFDELDGFPDKLKNEGSPVDLAKNRTIIPYEDIAKILYLSTPTVTQISKIIPLYKQGDQRNFEVPCVNCEQSIVLFWHLKPAQTKTGDYGGIIFETTESGRLIRNSVYYKCQLCGKLMTNDHKEIFLIEGKWKPTAEAQKDRFRSYWINALYSPVGMFSWFGMVESFMDCWDLEKNKVKDIEKYRSFRNTKQGRGFDEMGESMRFERVMQHRRMYAKNQIINEMAIQDTGSPVLLLIASVDVQNDRIFVDIKGYCAGGRSFTLDFRDIPGDTSSFEDPCWRELEKIIEQEIWVSDDKKQYRIIRTNIDGKHQTDNVYRFCRQYSEGVHPVLGEQWLPGGVVFKQSSKEVLTKAGCICYRINTTILKDRIAASFRRDWNTGEMQPEWRPNFPEDLREDYFKMFEAEYKAEKRDPKTNQFLGYIWKMVDHRRPNHGFDTFVYNLVGIEGIAEYACTLSESEGGLGLDSLNWPAFWEYAGKGHYYSEVANIAS